ncbi:MAG: endonuclease/exonuclease/phosphatase family protein [Planctomycetaceae bacterium]
MDEFPSPETVSRWLRFQVWFHRLCATLILAGSIMHAAVRDRYPFPLTLFYYGLPRPILFGLAVATALTAPRFSARLLWSAVAVVFAVVCWQLDFEHRAVPAETMPASGQTVIFWNVGRDLPDDVAVVDGFLESGADLFGLVETGDLAAGWLDDWQKRHVNHQLITLPNNCLIAVRGRVREQGEIPLSQESFASWADVEINGTVVRAVVVDLAANVWISRKEPLLKLAAALESWGDRPVIVMGDFNTPDDSVWFDHFPRDYREVFRTAGAGYAPTWPWPCPVLKLDQIWVSGGVQLLSARQVGNWSSDHRVVRAKVDWTVNTKEP